MMSLDLYILRFGKRLWGIERSFIHSFKKKRHRLLIEAEGCNLRADAVLAVTKASPVALLGSVTKHFWPEGCVGFALFEQTPVVVFDPRNVPQTLRVEEGETEHVERKSRSKN